MVKVFIDTNIYLDIYRKPENKNLFNAIIKLAETGNLIVTKQVVDEFSRNRYQVASQLLNEKKVIPQNAFLGLSIKNNILITDLLSSDAIIKQFEDEYKKSKKTVLVALNKLLQDIAIGQDKVSLFLAGYFSDPIVPTGEQISRAEARFRLGNPPRKSDSSMGDAINWEQLIDISSNDVELVIVTRDTDFTVPDGDSVLLNPFLFDECKRNNVKVTVFNDVLSATAHYNTMQNTSIVIEPEEPEDPDNAQVRQLVKCDHKRWYEEIRGRFMVKICENCGSGFHARQLEEEDFWSN